ncbi:18 kDa heat shock protein [archaeon HR06]|nr:18 kDa heat shock protein [archaeon HR06]
MFRELVKEVGKMSREFYELLTPPADIYEEGNELVVVIDLPGLKKEDISIRLTENSLSLSAKRTVPEGVIVHWQQRPLKLVKHISLPVKVKATEEVKAKYENGLLTVRIPIAGLVKATIE